MRKSLKSAKFLEMSRKSLIEFPLLEVEAAYHSYMDMADIIESMLKRVFKLLSIFCLEIDNDKIDLIEKPWRRISVHDAIKIHYKKDPDTFSDADIDQELELLGFDGHVNDNNFKKAKLINVLVKKYIISKLIEPTFLMDYPKLLSPLAVANKDNPALAERGYLYIGAQRLCEVVSEENDPEKQEQAFAFQDSIHKEENHVHEDLIDALRYGCPPTGGIGLNINRLVALLVGSDRLELTTFFPLSTSSINK